MMVLVKINRFAVRYQGKSYKAGDCVMMDEQKAAELVTKYGSAFTMAEVTGKKAEIAEELPTEEIPTEAELPAVDVTDAVVKKKKKKS